MDYLHLDHHHVLLQEAIPLSVQVCQTKRAFALWENMFTHADMKLSIVGDLPGFTNKYDDYCKSFTHSASTFKYDWQWVTTDLLCLFMLINAVWEE